MTTWMWVAIVVATVIVAMAARDMTQRTNPVARVFPLVGRVRRLVSRMGPKLRQYVIAADTAERPFNRQEREWVYASAEKRNNQIGFGTQRELNTTNTGLVFKHRTFVRPLPTEKDLTLRGFAGDSLTVDAPMLGPLKTIGRSRSRRKPLKPGSLVNLSGMSFGALSGQAVEALNRGAAAASCLHNTGEGGLSTYHRNGGQLIYQIGSGYFGCRDEHGRFNLEKLKEVVASAPIRALEIKLSQGAKPGAGGFIPGVKVTPEVAKFRGIPIGVDCTSPPRHSEFGDVDSMLDWVEMLAAATGLPVGIKSAVGDITFWESLAEEMSHRDRGVDFIVIDGAEGGTGAAPLAFADHIGYPFHKGFSLVVEPFNQRDLTKDIVFIGAGKLGTTARAAHALALGADMVNIGRTALLAMGCIQALNCHTDDCPTGIATQKGWLTRGIVPEVAGAKIANYIRTLRKELFDISLAAGLQHPNLLSVDDFDHLGKTAL